MTIDLDAFETAITRIDDGDIFEVFAKDFLASSLGYSFIPVGGSKDKGIDAFQYIFFRNGYEKNIIQISTEKGFEDKAESTVRKLEGNGIEVDRLLYVTNRKLNNVDKFVDRFFDKYKKPITVFDIRWFCANANINEHTIRSYQHFVDTYLHIYRKPGTLISIANLERDSRLYVFLGQQFDKNRHDLKLDNLLADTLILYGLEGTDPDQNKFRNSDEIKAAIQGYLKFDPKLIDEKINERLIALSSRPNKKINFHHKLNSYCLPYDTRVEIEQRNLKDEALFISFFEQTDETIKKYFKEVDVNVRDIQGLIKRVFTTIFKRQGLEFSNFVLHGDSSSVIEQRLNDVIGAAVDESSIVITNKEKVKTALHLAIRDIVYNGTAEQKRFLRSLSNTYLMMFLLQWEPKLSTYFQTLASQLKIFVDNSVIIPALSEYYLEDRNKRHWNLLKGAVKAGISLFINESLLDELATHFKMIRNKYYNVFHQMENLYISDEFELLFIDEILIRAFFYAKRKGHVQTFDDYINNFVDPSMSDLKRELITYLQDVLGIKYLSNRDWDIKVNETQLEKLAEVLAPKKSVLEKAYNDAEMILSIYHLRAKNREESQSGIFGYKTWWLSKDTSTYKAIVEAFSRDEFPVSCYIRPDFIYNYIALRPSSEEIDATYTEMFPTMLGVNMSYHMPKEVSQTVQQKIKEFHNKPSIRVKQILINLSDRLKSDPSLRNRNSVELFLDNELKRQQEGN